MKRKVSLLLSLVLTAICLLPGCATDKSGPIRIGTMPASVGVPVQYALDHGYFEEEGVDVTVELFQTGAPINEAIASDKLDLAFSGAAGIFSLANGTCVMLAEPDTAGGMGIYARPDSEIVQAVGVLEGHPDMMGSVETLTGAQVLLQLGTSGELNAQKYFELFGMERSEYELVHMDAGPAYQAILAGEGDLIAAYPPYSFQCEDAGLVEVCSFEEVAQYEISDSAYATKKIMESRRDDVVKVYKAVWRAIEELADDDVRYEYSMQFFADNGREYTEETMRQEMEVRRYRTKELLTDPEYVFGLSFVEQEDFYYNQGQITEDQLGNVKASLDPSVLNEVLGIEMKMPE